MSRRNERRLVCCLPRQGNNYMDTDIIAALPQNLQSSFCDDVPRTEFTDWTSLWQAGYDTRTNWKYEEGRVIVPGERARAIYVERMTVTPVKWQATKRAFEVR